MPLKSKRRLSFSKFPPWSNPLEVMRKQPAKAAGSFPLFLATFIKWSRSLYHLYATLIACSSYGVDGFLTRPHLPCVDCSKSRFASTSTAVTGETLPEVEFSNDSLISIQRLTTDAILYRGQPRGLSALQELAALSATRRPYEFDASIERTRVSDESVLTRISGFLDSCVTKEVCQCVQDMQKRGWLSTNPDSVDGEPSFHINLVSNGQPIECGDDEFGLNLQRLIDVVTPRVYHVLLPRVQELVGSTSIQIGDVFIRRYGQEVLDGKSRRGLSAHYDVYSMITSVIALDDVGAQGTDGLYTTALNEQGGTSNHAALRRFFPLSCGDAVVHSWDVLHGVDVQPNVNRTSLIVWFTSTDEATLRSRFVAPWLLNRQHEPVGQFVLASALEATRSESAEVRLSPFDLYLQSALSGSAFSLSRLGALCNEGTMSDENLDQAEAALDQLQSNQPMFGCIDNAALPRSARLATRFWLEASLRGNPFAQIALAEEIMAHEGTAERGNGASASESRLLAAVLFGLAAEQGDEAAIDALGRVVALDVSKLPALTQAEFDQLPVVKVARASLSFL